MQMKKVFQVALLLFSVGLFAQSTGEIKGTVTDKAMNNEPLLMAYVQLKDSKTVSQTNFHGNFEISDIPEGDYTLLISYLGYETLKVPVTITKNGTTRLMAEMEPKQLDLSTVVGLEESFPTPFNDKAEME